jgi:hypothetical protein
MGFPAAPRYARRRECSAAGNSFYLYIKGRQVVLITAALTTCSEIISLLLVYTEYPASFHMTDNSEKILVHFVSTFP